MAEEMFEHEGAIYSDADFREGFNQHLNAYAFAIHQHTIAVKNNQ